jgi:hypothetical protein
MNSNVDQKIGQNNLIQIKSNQMNQVKTILFRIKLTKILFLDIQQLVAKGRSLTQELNTCLHITTVQSKEENQIRELHSWACDSLLDYLHVIKIKYLKLSI